MGNTDTITIDARQLSPRLRAKIESGEYGTLRDLVYEGLAALEREEAGFDAVLRAKVHEALNDPRPDIPMEEVFERLERKHDALLAAANCDA